MPSTLQTYVTDLQRLLHDSTYNFWSLTEMTDYINKARKLVASQTGCTRQLTPVNFIAATTQAQATYSMNSLILNRTVTDVLDIMLQYSGNTTFPLKYLDFDTAKRTALWQYQKSGQPTHYTILNRQVIILPWPSIAYTANSFDCSVEPLDLSALADPDNDLIFPYTECVAFYAAYLCKLKDQRRDEANDYLTDYERRKLQCISAQMTRRLINQ